MDTKNKIKVVIMVPSALTARWESYFCADALSKVFDLEYWDCSAVAAVAFEANESLQRDYVRTINTMQTLENELKKLPKDAVCMSHIHLEDKRNYRIHKLISTYSKNRVGVNFWASAYTENIDFATVGDKKKEEKKPSESILHKIKRFLYQSRTIAYIAKYIWHRHDGKFLAWKNTPRGAEINWPLYNHYMMDVRPGSEYFINHPDYEKYLSLSAASEAPLVKGEYIVYVDQYFLHHPIMPVGNPGVNFKALIKPYYASLNRFFDIIEKKYGANVVIAAHPVADYKENPFGGREIFYYKTAELVKDSIGVCMHNSCSMSFVVLFNKPICLFFNKQMNTVPEMRDMTIEYSQLFHLPLVDIDNFSEEEVFTTLSPKVRYGFMKTFYDPTNKKTNPELFAENIIKIHDDIVAKMAEQN